MLGKGYMRLHSFNFYLYLNIFIVKNFKIISGISGGWVLESPHSKQVYISSTLAFPRSKKLIYTPETVLKCLVPIKSILESQALYYMSRQAQECDFPSNHEDLENICLHSS